MKKEPANPYVGLRPYEAEESLLFFGRAEQTLELLQRLHQHHFVAVVGSSGCGKSSLLRAGLIPSLKAGYLVEDSDQWFVGIMKPGQNPLYNLAETLLQQLNSESNAAAVTELVTKIKEEGVDAILEIITSLRKKTNLNFFLLVDQFEELFRFTNERTDIEKRDDVIDFVNIMLELSTQSVLPFYVVMTMRSDFIGDCSQFFELPEAMNKSLYLVPKLSRQQLKKVIESPAKLFGGKLNPTLTTRLLNELGKVKDELPLLQHALMRMWDFEVNIDKSGELDLTDYQKIGGIENTLSKHADEALKGMGAEDLLLTKNIFQALTAIDENGRKVRHPVLLSQLKELTGEQEEKLLNIINRFIEDKRSFLVLNNAGANDKVIDISHESLIRQWVTLSEWVDEEGEAASIYLQLNEAAKSHQQKRKDLLYGSELHFTLDWYDKVKPHAAWANRYKEGFEESIEYLDVSKKEQSRLEHIQKRQKGKRLIINGTIAGLFIFLLLVTFFYINSQKLNREIRLQKLMSDSLTFVAQTQSLELYEESEKLILQKDKSDSVAIVASAQKIIAIERSKEAISQKNKADSIAIIANEQRILAEVEKKKAVSQKKRADSAVIMAKDQMNKAQANYLISSAYRNANNDPTLALNLVLEVMKLTGSDIFEKDALKIYAENSFYKIIESNDGYILSVAYSPDGKTIFTGSTGIGARLWNLEGEMLQEFKGHKTSITSVAFSTDGKTIITGSYNSEVCLWNLDGVILQEFIGHTGEISSVAFSPDGKTILTGSWDQTARLWNLDGEIIQVFIGHTDRITSVTFSPNGKTILTGSRDQTARLWNLEGKMLKKLKGEKFKGHRGEIVFVDFSPDGEFIQAYYNGFISSLWWNLDGKKQLNFYGPGVGNTSIAVSPNRNIVLAGYEDGEVYLLDYPTKIKEFKGHTEDISSVAFSPDGNTILTGSRDGTARLWSMPMSLEEFLESGWLAPLTAEQKEKYGIEE